MGDTSIVSLTCSSCGASLYVPQNVDTLKCQYCGTTLMVERSAASEAANAGKQVSQSIQESGAQTQASIKESTEVTQAQLQRMQVNQLISALQMQLLSTQSEIRSLEREKLSSRGKKQLKQLRSQERSINSRIQDLTAQLIPAVYPHSMETVQKSIGAPAAYQGKDWKTAFILCTLLGMFGAHRFYLGRKVSGFVYLFTLGLALVGWIIDFILLAVGALRDQYQLKLNNRSTHVSKSWLVSGIAYMVILFIILLASNDATSALIGAVIAGGIGFLVYYFVTKGKSLVVKVP